MDTAPKRMRSPVKKMYLYIIKRYLPLLMMTFLVCWFIVLMQFLWQYVDELVGKGMNLWLTLQLIFYAALFVLNLSVPLGILLASLMTFGKLGEELELLSMKSAGVPLWRIMKPIMAIVVAIALGLFVYLNVGVMHVSVRMYQILFSARFAQPELDIPEGVFFNGIKGYSLLVNEKDPKTGTLKGVMIYDNSAGFANARIIRADSGSLKMDQSKTFLTLQLFGGESFQNLKEQGLKPGEDFNNSDTRPLPYIKEFFKKKTIILPFDANFHVTEDDFLRSQFVGKNIFELKHYSDSLKVHVDSAGIEHAKSIQTWVKESLSAPKNGENGEIALDEYALREQLSSISSEMESDATANNPSTELGILSEEQSPQIPDLTSTRADNPHLSDPSSKDSTHSSPSSAIPQTEKPSLPGTFTIDSLYAVAGADQLTQGCQGAIEKLTALKERSQALHSAYTFFAEDYVVNAQEKHRKITFPVACIIFFLIGAPLGAIVRKGGIGTPVVAAVFIFIVYYVIETFGLRAVSSSEMPIWLGMWLSTFAILPLGLYLTIQASRDSSSLNTEALAQAIKQFFRPGDTRSLPYKELILQPLSPQEAISRIQQLQKLVLEVQQYPCRREKWRHWRWLFHYNILWRATAKQIDTVLMELRDYPSPTTMAILEQIPLWHRGVSRLIPKNRYLWYALLPIIPISLPLLVRLLLKHKKRAYCLETTLRRLQDALQQVESETKSSR